MLDIIRSKYCSTKNSSLARITIQATEVSQPALYQFAISQAVLLEVSILFIYLLFRID